MTRRGASVTTYPRKAQARQLCGSLYNKKMQKKGGMGIYNLAINGLNQTRAKKASACRCSFLLSQRSFQRLPPACRHSAGGWISLRHPTIDY